MRDKHHVLHPCPSRPPSPALIVAAILPSSTARSPGTPCTGDLLLPVAPAERTAGERASAAMDFINDRFGAGTIRMGINRPHPGFFERG